jgi:hypothetical protein
MAEVSFSYKTVDFPPDRSFPDGRRYRRPVVKTILGSGKNRSSNFFSILDSGADLCSFPLQFGIQIGVITDPELGNHDGITMGAGSSNMPTFYRDITLAVEHLGAWGIKASFTAEADARGFGLLGGMGFFDRFPVRFDMPSGLFHVTIPDQSPSTPVQDTTH